MKIIHTVLFSLFTTFRLTSAIRHLFTLAWLRSGGAIKSVTFHKVSIDCGAFVRTVTHISQLGWRNT